MSVQRKAATGERAAELIKTALVWHGHAGFAYERASDLAELSRWKKSGVNLVSVNIGYDAQGWTSAVEGVSKYRHFIRAHREELVQVETIVDVERARRENKLAVYFDIEGANALNGDPGMVDFYYLLGVRQLLFVYNRANLASAGESIRCGSALSRTLSNLEGFYDLMSSAKHSPGWNIDKKGSRRKGGFEP